MRIVDPETDEPLPPGEVGEIVVRPKATGIMMKEYNNVPAKTIDAWRNLWFHTGDAGRMDEEGYLYFTDRVKDTIRRRGENISSFSIESVVITHPSVAESAAVAVPAGYGAGSEDEVKVCVVLEEETELDPGNSRVLRAKHALLRGPALHRVHLGNTQDGQRKSQEERPQGERSHSGYMGP